VLKIKKYKEESAHLADCENYSGKIERKVVDIAIPNENLPLKIRKILNKV
jgi:hypothetical protein